MYQIGDVVLINKYLPYVNSGQVQTLKDNNYIGTITSYFYFSGAYYKFKLEEYDFCFCENDFVGKLIGNRIVRCG